jgi:ankyrin repeat protein
LLALLVLLAALALAGCGEDEAPPDLDGRLLDAAYANDVERARGLIADGADVNAKDDSEQSAYLIATSEVGPGTELLELTLANGAEVDAKDSFNGTGLIRAAERGHAAICRRLLEAGIDKDHVNRLGWTALLEAVMLGDGGPDHVETVRVLVDGGVDTAIADREGVTPLQHARRKGYDEIARILRESR